jgi:predicted transcriptional regulator
MSSLQKIEIRLEEITRKKTQMKEAFHSDFEHCNTLINQIKDSIARGQKQASNIRDIEGFIQNLNRMKSNFDSFNS